MAKTPITHIIFWKSAVRTFRWNNMYIALTDLSFLLKLAQNCKKCTFLGKLSAIKEEENIKTKQMTSFFICFFHSACNIHFCISEYSKFILMWSAFWYVLVFRNSTVFSKSYQFGQPIILLWKVNTLKLLKTDVMVCPQKRAKKLYQLLDYV